ncbi:nucleotidyl transferase AbiEii/AbiGii toxin family protein [Candidatus Micrarchaeota archaeon]|nr:nucleotidyl transferase AbiEii/AbiGii toxin family protein [Candidatus Micrarchaeota archaeon]
MIEKKELMEIARIKGLKPWQQEKHYLQAVILEVLAEQPLVFKGGTYLWFFHSLPRFSEDLDFTAKEIMPKNLAETVSKSLELFGIQNTNKIISNNETTLSFRISAKGPLNTKQIDECRVYVEISKREKIEEKILPIKLDFPEYNLSTKRASGMNLNEIAAEKIRAILTRKKARDLYDLHYLIEKKQVSFNQKLADKKLAFYNKKFSKKEFLEKAIEKKDYFKKELKNIVFDELPEFNQTIKTIKKWIK